MRYVDRIVRDFGTYTDSTLLQSQTIRHRLATSPEYKQAWVEKSRKGALNARKKGTAHTPTTEERRHIRRADMRLVRIRERAVLESLKPMYNLLVPSMIIDAIGFKDGKAEFIEVKLGSGDLSAYQRRLRDFLESHGFVYRVVRAPLEGK